MGVRWKCGDTPSEKLGCPEWGGLMGKANIIIFYDCLVWNIKLGGNKWGSFMFKGILVG